MLGHGRAAVGVQEVTSGANPKHGRGDLGVAAQALEQAVRVRGVVGARILG